MSKYIDADLLRKDIDNWKEAMADAVGEYSDGVRFALEHFTFVLDSLQQEQSAQRGYKDCNGCEYNRLLKDQIGWQFRGCFGGDYKGKPIAEIELCPLKVAQQEHPTKGYDEAYLNECIAKASKSWEGVDVDKFMDEVRGREQEQPEVDLEKEFQEYWCLHQYDYRLRRQVMDGHGKAVLENIARHFYKLGLNARKEE